MSDPLVSVVIPTYNQPALLLESLESVFAQTFRDYEVIVVNDGSTDDTVERLRPLEGRIRVISQENAAIGRARDRGIAEARGKYVALLDHDDLWLPRKLEAQVEFYRRHPECSAVIVPWAYSTNPAKWAFTVTEQEIETGIIERPIRHMAGARMCIMSSSMMFDRERAQGLRHATERRCIEDTPFHINLFARGPLGLASKEILMIYRWHAQNASNEATYFGNGLRLMRKMHRAGEFEAYQEHPEDVRALLAHIGRIAAVRQLLAGNRSQGLLTYIREFPHQMRCGRWRFVGMYPAMLLAPRAVLARRWDVPAK